MPSSLIDATARAWVSPETHRFIWANEPALQLFGVDGLEEFRRFSIYDFSPEFQPDGESSAIKARRHLQIALEKGGHDFDWRHQNLGGQQIDAFVIATRIEHEGAVLLQTSCRDFSAERQALRELQRQRHEHDQIMGAISASTLVSWTDTDGVILDINDQFCQRSGYPRDELIGRTHDVVIPASRPPEIRAGVLARLRAGQLWTGILEYETKSGDPFFLKTVITPIRAEDGRVLKYLGIQTDLTRELKTERTLNNAQELARTGSYEFHLEAEDLRGSANFYRLYRLDPRLRGAAMLEALRSRVHPEDLDAVMGAWQRMLTTGEDYFLRHRLKFEDQTVTWIECRGSLLKDAKGTRMAGTSIDVTETVLREEEFKKLLDYNAAIVNSANVMIVTTDENGTITGLNDVAAKAFGYGAEEVTGRKALLDLLTWDQNDDLLASPRASHLTRRFDDLADRARRGRIESRPWKAQRQDGSHFEIEFSLAPLRNPLGKLYGFIGVARDVTEENAIREALEVEKAKSLHSAKLASLGEMAAGIAHEINNPLAMIYGSIELIETHRHDDERFQRKLEIIRKASSRIEKIVKGLQKFARTTGKHDARPADLHAIIQDALVLINARARQFGVEIRYEVHEPIWIRCDALEIEQVIINLLQNGIDAVKNTSARWIRVSATASGNFAILKVTDAGRGIPAHIEPKLFQPFFTTKPVGEGTGLGLSIVKGILDEHGAGIRVGQDGGNTCFEVRLPVCAPPRETPEVNDAT